MWADEVTADEASRRGGGRRRYNAHRSLACLARQVRVVELLSRYGFFRAGARIARELGVSRATICRDRASILRDCTAARTRKDELREAARWFLRRHGGEVPTVGPMPAEFDEDIIAASSPHP